MTYDKERPSERRKALLDLLSLATYSARFHPKPISLQADRIPQRMREALKELRSEDIKTDNWHLRYSK